MVRSTIAKNRVAVSTHLMDGLVLFGAIVFNCNKAS